MEALTFAQWRRLMCGTGKGKPQGIFAGSESWITRECREALEDLDDRNQVSFDVTWENGQPVFTRRGV